MASEVDSMPISEAAAHWWTLLHSGSTTSDDQFAFSEWVARSPERVEAYLQTARLMRALKSDRVRWPNTSIGELIRDAKASAQQVITVPGTGNVHSARLGSRSPAERRFHLHRRTPYVVAASLLVVVASAWVLWRGPEQYRTRFGEQRSVLLEDGSRVTLNTASHVEVSFQKTRRLVRMLQGEALFNVAHDAARPFEVEAGHTLLRAVGTQFDVDVRRSRTTITVVEGKVAVVSESGSSAVREESAALSPPVLEKVIKAHERVVITSEGTGNPQTVADLASATAWMQRRLVFDHQPLSEVVEEFNRYNPTPIVLEDAQLQRQEVTGVFQSDDPESFLSFLSNVPGVEIREANDGTRVVTAGVTAPK
jgi:transmembrane sensor